MANALQAAALPRTRVRAAAPPSPLENYAVATVLCLLIATIFIAMGPGARHWFVLPTTLAGILALSDVVGWVRRQYDTFDPKALVGAVLFHTAFMAPFLHMGLEAHDPQFESIGDWGRWFGILGTFQILAICCYKISQLYFFRQTRPTRAVWAVNPGRFGSVIVWAIAISGLFAAIVLVRFGGLSKEGEGVSVDIANQLSWIMMLSDPFPILMMMGIITYLARTRRSRSRTFVLTLLAAFLIGQFLILGLRGSRSAMIFALVLVTIMAHYRLRRLSPGLVLLGFLAIGVGGYFYKFYKEAGSAGAKAALSGGEGHARLSRQTRVTPVGVLLGDLARANVQAFALFRYMEFGDRYKLRYGETYLMAAAVVIPRAVWKNKPITRSEALTDLFYGEGTYRGGTIRSSRILGLLGESILNFGLLGIPIMFLVYGAVVGWYRKKILTFDPADGRFFIVPMFTLALMLVPFGDSDNIAFGFLKNGALPIGVVLLSTTRMARVWQAAAPAARSGS
jgi:hypothetical protein